MNVHEVLQGEDFVRWAVREHKAVDYCGEYCAKAGPKKPWWMFWR